MRIELVLFVATSAIVANMYTDGRLVRKVMSYRKYYEMSGVVTFALFLYYVLKKNPCDSQKLIMSTNEYLKYLPIDKNASDILTPILNLTSRNPSNSFFHNEHEHVEPSASIFSTFSNAFLPPNESGGYGGYGGGGGGGGGGSTKRSVSETKKKFVAAQQNWRCKDCGNQLNAWFEIDHTVRLEHGGSNHVDNLAALCRECHGKKTTFENL